MKNTLKTTSVIIGTLIGAGFASGKEIYIFFAKYGAYGIIGIIISTILTSLIIYKTLKIIKKHEINNYKQFLQAINKKGNKIINYIVSTFLLVTFFIMIAGFSAYIKQLFGINTYISSAIFVLICYIVLTKSIKGVIKINELLIPILVIFITYIGIKNVPYILETKISEIALNETSSKIIEAIISGILYASYNSIILIPVLTSFKKYIQKEKAISIITGIIIITLALLIYGLLLRGINFAKELEMPLIQIIKEFGNVYTIIYEFVIITAIFTSAISTSYSFLENIKKENYKKILILICIIGIIVSNIGFSNLIQILYPIFGVLGLIQIAMITVENKKIIKSIENEPKN